MTREEFLISVRPLCFPSFIYAARSSQFIKIGLAKDPKRRMKQLTRNFGEPFELLATCPGSRWNEAELHREWRQFSVGREFFDLPPIELQLLLHRMNRTFEKYGKPQIA